MSIRNFSLPLLLLALIGAPAIAAPALVISPGNQISVQNGDTLTLDLKFTGLGNGTAPSVGAYDIDVGFNPTLLGFNSVTWGNGLDLFGLGDIRGANPGLGSINLMEVSLESAADLDAIQPSDFPLASLSFTGLNAGNSSIAASFNAIGDAVGNPLAITIQYGNATTVTVAEPNSALLALFGLPLLWVSRRIWRTGLK